jgi:hypothetical protein
MTMKTLVLFQMLLLPLASLAQDAQPTIVQIQAAQDAADLAGRACSPFSVSYRGDVVIHTQAQADKYQCYRRILGSLTIVQPGLGTIRLPKLRAVNGDVHIVHRAGQHDQILAACLPELREIGGRVELERRSLGATDLSARASAGAR